MRVIANFARPVLLAAALSVSVVPAVAAEKLVVTGARIPTPLERFAGAATIITAADIALYQYRDLADALASVPGLHVAASGAAGAQTSVFMRGAESNHVLVLIDGVEVTDPAGGGIFGFEHLQLNNVERIEVLRGPYSAQYGSEGIGGVINIVTRRGDGAPDATARIEAGSFATDAAAVGLSGRYDRVDFSLAGAWLQSDGESFTPRKLRDGRGEERDGYDNFDVKGTVGVETGYASRVDFNFGYAHADVEFDGASAPFEQAGLRSSMYAKRYAAHWSGEYAHGVWRPVLQGAYYSRQSDDAGRGERTKFEWRNDLFFSDALKFTLGAETELEKVRGSVRDAARTKAVYAQAQVESFDALVLSGGWRNDDADDFGGNRSWQLAAVYAPGASDVRVRASYGVAFKAPTLFERFAYFPGTGGGSDFRGNPDLEPETSRSREFGVEQTFAVGGSDDGRDDSWGGGWGAAYFDNRIRDLIASSPDRSTLRNIASAHIEGVEAFVFLDIGEHWNARLDYTVMRTRDGDRARLLRRPIRKTTLDARWSNVVWTFAAKVDYIGPRDDIGRDDFARVAKGGYALVNATARRRVNENLILFARVDNLFDRSYEPIDGFAGSSVGLHVGVEVGM